jgi:hypothetical protein
MSHEKDPPKPRDPNRKPGEHPDDDLPDLADIDDAAEGGVSFDIPPPEGRYESQTMGVAFADLAEIPEFANLVSRNDADANAPSVPTEAFSPVADDHVVDADELVPIADAIPSADPGSSSSHLARIDPPSGVKIDSSVKLAKFAGSDKDAPAAEASGDSGVMNLEPLNPVLPASGWFDSHGDSSLQSVEPMMAEPLSSDSGGLGGKPPAGAIESSDIFGGGASKLSNPDLADVSDVIAATVGTPPQAQPGDPANVPFGSNRNSDVALSFDGPPGGSTVADPGAIEELPEATEMADELWNVPEAESVFDSGKLAAAPDLPDARNEQPDFGATPVRASDASSIMGELGGPSKNLFDDASGVSIEAPGMSGTLRGEHHDLSDYPSDIDLTASDEPLPKGGSNLFGSPTEPEIMPRAGVRDDAIEDITEDQASLASDQSSIFTGEKTPKKGTIAASGDSRSVPISRPDVDITDSVDFSDHPDLEGADSGSFHGTTPVTLADDEQRTPAKPAKVKPVGSKQNDPSVEMAWVAQSSIEAEPVASGKPSRGRRRDRDDDDRTSSTRPAAPVRSGRGLDRVLGLVFGTILGTGVCAALYLTGTIPNGSKTEPGTTANANKGLETGTTGNAAEITKLTADLKEANEKADAAEKEMKTQKDAAGKLDKELKAQAAAVTKAETDVRLANDKVTKLEADIKDVKTTSATVAADLKKAKDEAIVLDKEAKTQQAKAETLDKDLKAQLLVVTKLEKEVKDQKEQTIKVETDLKAKLKETSDLVTAAEKASADKQAALDAVAKELQAKKLLGEKYDAKSLLAATKDAADRATGPNLSSLFPSGMAALGGGPLTAGQLLDIADRLGKAETATKTLQAEMAKAAAAHDAQVKKLKDDQAADVKAAKDKADADAKKAADTYAANVKKLNDDHAAELKKVTDANGLDKLKEAHAAELKKAADKYADDKKKLLADGDAAAKKLKDDQAAELKKVADDNAKQVSTLQAAIALEKEKAVILTKKFEADLGNAMSPSQALDQWLTILSGLRRPADADPAIAAANKVLATAPAGSEDVAKAQTVRGLAHLIKGEGEAAKSWFTQAKATPAYKEAVGKAAWAKAADLGLASVEDPLAPLRRPVDKAVPDKAVAAKYLDAGINAYKSGKYKEAQDHLIQAAWNDDSSPLAYYFLGAARWQLQDTAQAKKDFTEGGTREKARTVSARSIDVAITPIQGPARDALAAARP